MLLAARVPRLLRQDNHAAEVQNAAVGPLLALVKYLTYINGALALFNLIPGFPLDRGRILRAIIWNSTHSLRRTTLIAATVGRMIAFVFILWGVWQIFGPISWCF